MHIHRKEIKNDKDADTVFVCVCVHACVRALVRRIFSKNMEWTWQIF